MQGEAGQWRGGERDADYLVGAGVAGWFRPWRWSGMEKVINQEVIRGGCYATHAGVRELLAGIAGQHLLEYTDTAKRLSGKPAEDLSPSQ